MLKKSWFLFVQKKKNENQPQKKSKLALRAWLVLANVSLKKCWILRFDRLSWQVVDSAVDFRDVWPKVFIFMTRVKRPAKERMRKKKKVHDDTHTHVNRWWDRLLINVVRCSVDEKNVIRSGRNEQMKEWMKKKIFNSFLLSLLVQCLFLYGKRTKMPNPFRRSDNDLTINLCKINDDKALLNRLQNANVSR